MKYKQSKKPLVSIRLEPKLSDFGLSIIVECIYIECIITLLDKSLIKLFTEFTWTWHDKLNLLNYHLLFLHLKCHVFHGIWVYTNMKDCENMKNSWQPFLSGPLFYITHIFFYFFGTIFLTQTAVLSLLATLSKGFFIIKDDKVLYTCFQHFLEVFWEDHYYCINSVNSFHIMWSLKLNYRVIFFIFFFSDLGSTSICKIY